MNGLIAAGVGLGLMTFLGMAGPPINKGTGHRVVFEFVSEEARQQESLLNNVENLLKALGSTTQILVVAHGGGLILLYHPDKKIAERIRELASKRVVFAACENTMQKKHVKKEDLVREAITVDSGVAEVVRRQEDGWSYIRSGA